MKFLVLYFFVSSLAQAQMPNLSGATALLKDKSAKVLAACKDDRKNIKGCEKYFEFEPLKECLLKNKDALSVGCKSSLTD